MVSESDYSTLRSIVDIIGFVMISVAHIIYAIIKMCIPNSYKPKKNIAGEIILITGGGSGLGRLLAIKLARLKAIVIVWDVNEEGIKETVKMVQGDGGKAYGYKCDLTNREDVYKVAEKIFVDVGEVTILINNAGVVSGYLLLDTPDHLIQRTFEVNAISHFWTTKAFLPKMIQNQHGHIVTIASMAGHTGTKKLVDYCSSKFAAVGFDEALRVELEALGIKGVKTTVVCPYFIQSTGMFNDVKARFVSKLQLTHVAERVVKGILREDIYVFIPSIFRYVFWTKWIFPWAIVSMYLRNLVPDANPSTSLTQDSIKDPTFTDLAMLKKKDDQDLLLSDERIL
nr:estradiol 17-beta-dehydrogenase 11-like [Onthophagus taurus]XP_022916265.1 estradiol 17-beta-dehydrogenase 11-like [Onthophagus taurus]